MFSQPPKFDEFFANLAEANKKWLDGLTGTANFAQNPENSAFNAFQGFFSNTKGFLDAQNSFYQEQLQIWSQIANKKEGSTEDKKVSDKRFSDEGWDNNPFFSYLKQSYESFSKHLLNIVGQAGLSDEEKEKFTFFIQQYLAAIAPSNFPLTNPEVIKAFIDTKGKSFSDGMQNLLQDSQNGYMSMTDESLYEVGVNLAATEGSVIYRNSLVELIQYKPTTEKVYETPLLIVPPCINKYYILDLQQSNSLVKYYVDQGYTVFLVSWKSADAALKKYRWEEYVNIGVIDSIETVRSISKKDKINVLGYCVGGAILTTAALLLKDRNLDYINTMTHLTSLLDYEDPGEIKLYLNKDMEKVGQLKKDGGIMAGRIIAQTFSSLRPNDLIWNYWVNNYLLGKTPPAFDLLFWNNDAVDLPVPMHQFYIDNLYNKNKFAKGEFVVDGVKLDLSKIDYPVYLFAAQKDHIVPWNSAYKSTQLLKNAQVKFVLGASGHTAGVVNPVVTDKRNYWVNDALPASEQEWFTGSTSMPGSWWKDYNAWLAQYSGKQVKAPATAGNKDFPVICVAPGEYVKAKGLSIVEASLI
ncbi:MAG: alpha/beta fold hydrolase [Burkholderiales bacterium]|nr:alpha/beta fold hydrolase [Burkholderiales bacterium]